LILLNKFPLAYIVVVVLTEIHAMYACTFTIEECSPPGDEVISLLSVIQDDINWGSVSLLYYVSGGKILAWVCNNVKYKVNMVKIKSTRQLSKSATSCVELVYRS